MAFIDALAALCLNRRDLADGQIHRRPAIWPGRSAETIYANLGRRQSRPAPRRRRAQPFRGLVATVGGCGLRLRFVVSAKGREGARRPAPSPDGPGRARPRSRQSSKLTYTVLSQQWRGERVEQT